MPGHQCYLIPAVCSAPLCSLIVFIAGALNAVSLSQGKVANLFLKRNGPTQQRNDCAHLKDFTKLLYKCVCDFFGSTSGHPQPVKKKEFTAAQAPTRLFELPCRLAAPTTTGRNKRSWQQASPELHAAHMCIRSHMHGTAAQASPRPASSRSRAPKQHRCEEALQALAKTSPTPAAVLC